MKKKLLCMGLVVVFAASALAFAGCGGEGEKAELEKQLSAVQATVQTQKEELDALKKENADLQKQVDDYNAQIESLEQRLSEWEYEQIHAPLNEKTETQIREDYLRQYGHAIHYYAFYGNYHDCYAFFVTNDDTVVKKVTVGGQEFFYHYGWEIYIWKEGSFKTLQEAYDANWLTQTNLRLLAEYHKKATEPIGGAFYAVEEAYKKGLLSRNDILHIASYATTQLGITGSKHYHDISDEVFAFQPTEPLTKLTEQEESAIITAYYRHDPELYAAKDKYAVKILEYYGRYNGVYAINIWTDFYGYGDSPIVHHEIAGIKFLSSNPGIWVFVPKVV